VTIFFPVASILLNVAAAGVYFWRADWWHGAYFLAGAAITGIATFGLRS